MPTHATTPDRRDRRPRTGARSTRAPLPAARALPIDGRVAGGAGARRPRARDDDVGHRVDRGADEQSTIPPGTARRAARSSVEPVVRVRRQRRTRPCAAGYRSVSSGAGAVDDERGEAVHRVSGSRARTRVPSSSCTSTRTSPSRCSAASTSPRSYGNGSSSTGSSARSRLADRGLELLDALARAGGDRRSARCSVREVQRRRPGPAASTLFNTSSSGRSTAPISRSTSRTASICASASGALSVDDVQEQVGVDHLLERRPERLDQLVRESAHEADRVGQQHRPRRRAGRAAGSSGRGSRRAGPRRARPLGSAGSAASTSPRSCSRPARPWGCAGGAGPCAASCGSGPGGSRSRSSFVIRRWMRRRSTSSWVSPGPRVPIPAPCWLSSRPRPRRRGQAVAQLGELDLDHALLAAGVLGEDVEDQRDPVDDVALEQLLEVALLRRA